VLSLQQFKLYVMPCNLLCYFCFIIIYLLCLVEVTIKMWLLFNALLQNKLFYLRDVPQIFLIPNNSSVWFSWNEC